MSEISLSMAEMKMPGWLSLPKNASRRLTGVPETVDPRAERLLAYWRENASRESGLPDRRAFDATRMIEWLGFFSIYEFDEADDDYYNRLEGTFIADLTGEDWTGRRATEVDAYFGSRFRPDLDAVRQHREPVVELVQIYQNDFGQAVRILLPVSKSGGRAADQIFVAMFACDQDFGSAP